jgi:hypothetical protein
LPNWDLNYQARHDVENIGHRSVQVLSAIPEGTILSAVGNATGRIDLTALQLTTEPDGAMGSFENYQIFLEQQERLAQIQNCPEIVFFTFDGQRFAVEPELAGRPLTDLTPDFWMQCMVGLVAWLVSAGVYVFRREDTAARYLLLSGGYFTDSGLRVFVVSLGLWRTDLGNTALSPEGAFERSTR